uniref:hypothetical protein n=1 Tax=uncultured Sphingomonas sp. TaxID=158754 RepID=UPI0035CB562F
MLVTDALVRSLLAAERIVPVLQSWVGRAPELHAVFPTGGAKSLKIRLLVDFVAEHFAT